MDDSQNAGDKFEHVHVGDVVEVSRKQMPSLRYAVYHVTAKRFHGREVTHGWLADFRKRDGRSIGGRTYMIAEPTAPDAERIHDKSRCDAIVAAVLAGVCDLPDYDSPDDKPEQVTCTLSELETILRRALGKDL